jgi:tartrate-resistant acid phosphatase type 5
MEGIFLACRRLPKGVSGVANLKQIRWLVPMLVVSMLLVRAAPIYAQDEPPIKDQSTTDPSLDRTSQSGSQRRVQSTESQFDYSFSTYLPAVLGVDESWANTTEDAVPIPFGSNWKFLDDGSTPPTAWTAIAFDDGEWREGGAMLGYGDSDVVTQVSYGADPLGKHITSYFRHSFTIEDPEAYKSLDLQLRRDDGAVVYLNGEEIYRSNMPGGPVTAETLALTGVVGVDAEDAVYLSTVAADLLVEGRNVLAVEVHQGSPESSDLGFDLALLATDQDSLRFAAIGDYGAGMRLENGRFPVKDVADLVKSWSPDLVITLGDNNYLNGLSEESWDGRTETIDDRIGQFYGEFISPYFGTYADGAGRNRFFPSLGNHDWNCAYLDDPALNCGTLPQPYLDYFSLPGNERYYEFTEGPVNFFVVDSDARLNGDLATQKTWLAERLSKARKPWKIVYFHHAPYNVGGFRPERTDLRWDFKQWGASAILTGHDHLYNRQVVADLPYFVNGLGGMTRYACDLDRQGNQPSPFCYSDDYGAMLVVANDCQIQFQFISRHDKLIDTYMLEQCGR